MNGNPSLQPSMGAQIGGPQSQLGTPVPGTTGGLPAQRGLSVTANPMAERLRSMGRGEDKMLVHMTPGEVGGLQQLAMAHGGSLTINPQTGLPEAGFLSKLLPTILGIAGAAFGLPTWAIGLGVGAGQTALTGDLGKGLSAGLQAFGGAGIGQAAGLGGKLGSLGKDIGLTQSMTGGVASGATTADATKAIIKSNDMRGLATAGANAAQKAPGFLGKFGAETALGQKGMIGKALPMMAGSAVLGGVSDAFKPKLPTYKEEDDGFNYEGPYVPGARKASFQPYEEMKRTGGAEGTYFTPSNPVPGYRPIASLSPDEQEEYGFAEGGLAEIPTPAGFNDLVSFFGASSPGAVTASMYPTGVAPSAPTAQPTGPIPPREQTYNFANRPPPTTAPTSNPYADYGYMDVPGVGNIMIPGFSQYDFSNIDWDAIARQQNYIPKAEQLVIREPDMSGIYDRFGSIENQLRNMPTPQAPDLTGIYDRFGQIENQLQNLPTPQSPDLTGIYDRFGQIENQLQNLPTTDFSGVLDRIGGVENQLRNLPPADFSSVLDRIGGVENQLQNIPTTDLTGIYDRFGSIESQLRGMPTYQEPDLSGIYDRFGQIENRLQNIPTTDLTGVYDRFGQIESQLQNLPTPQAPDLTGVFDRFGQLESRINSLPTPQATDLSGVYDRFGQLEGRLNSLPTPQAPDLSGIYDRFGQLEGRINSLPTPQATDLSGIQSQLDALRGQYQPTDLSGIQSQIEALRGQYQPTDLSGIQSQIEALGGRISNLPTPQATDLSGIQSQIEALRGQYQPTDLSGIQSQIEALRGQYQPTDLSGIQSQIEALRGQVGSMPAPQATDLSGIYDRFGQLEGRLNSLPTPQATDLSGIQAQIEALRGQVGSIPAPQATDLSGIQSQIEALRGQYQPTDLSGIQSQIESLRGQVGSIPAPQATDLSGIQSQIAALQGQYQPTDLSGVMAELQALRDMYSGLSNVQGGTGGTPTTISDGGFYAKGGAVDMADGAFVVDARTVSELGNGSSNAGMELLSRMGGRPLHGPGDGVSDSIPARIGGKQEARVARDEVIFQPDAVKRIGGGSEQRGTAKLYNLMDRAHKARKKAKRGQDTGLRRGLA